MFDMWQDFSTTRKWSDGLEIRAVLLVMTVGVVRLVSLPASSQILIQIDRVFQKPSGILTNLTGFTNQTVGWDEEM